MLGVVLEWLRAPEDDSLRRAFPVWLRHVLLPARLPGVLSVRLREEWGARIRGRFLAKRCVRGGMRHVE